MLITKKRFQYLFKYFDSKFLHHLNVQKLFGKLLGVTNALDIEKVLQLLKDGPNVNWDVCTSDVKPKA